MLAYLKIILAFFLVSGASVLTNAQNIKKEKTPSFSLKNEEVSIITLLRGKPNAIAESKEFDEQCGKWTINQQVISEIIKYAEPVSTHDFMYLYYVLPCEYHGTLQVGKTIYTFSINAGSFMKLTKGESTYYFGFPDNACSKYFLETGGDPKRDLEN